MKNKLEIVRQREEKDCGPCCILTLIKYYGGNISLEKIKEDCYTDIDGTSVYHMVEALKQYGFDAIAKKSPDKIINNSIFPLIAHVVLKGGLTHFVIVKCIQNNKVKVLDPAYGKKNLTIEEFTKMFSGVYIEVVPQNEIVYFSQKHELFDTFISILKVNKNLIINLIISSFLLTIFTIIYGMYIKVMYNDISNFEYKKHNIYLFLIALSFKVILMYLRNIYKNHLNKNIDIDTNQEFISHIFNLPLSVISKKKAGEIMTRVNELSIIKDIFSDIVVNTILDAFLIIATIICLLFINKEMLIISLAIMSIYTLISIFFNTYIYKKINMVIDKKTVYDSNLVESISMINSIKNLHKEKYFMYRLEESFSDYLYDNFKLNETINIIESIKTVTYEGGMFFLYVYSFSQIYIGKLSIINFITFTTIMLYFTDPIKSFLSSIPKINYFRASYKKICDFMNMEEEKNENIEKLGNKNIIFRDVWFSYNNYHYVLKKCSFDIKHQEKVMIVGKSGTGKSSICHLIQKLYVPNKGNIYIGNKNISDYNLETLKNNILYVGQKEKIFTESIKTNIKMDCNDVEKFDKVCKICHIEDIVSKKMFRYDFGIENNSGNISGGEKQRIVLARSLMRDFEILILDESLSEVDYKLEKNIIKNILEAYKDKTIIYISHKSHEKLFDRIIRI